jgi:hypothetical protein
MTSLHLPIASPCHEDWDAMDPSARGRFCHSCAKDVHDLAVMTEREARDLLAANAGQRICVRYLADREGRIRFRPEAVARAAVAGLALAACTPHDNPTHANLRQQPAIEHVVPRVDLQPEVRPTMGEAPMVEVEPVRPASPIMGGISAPPPPVVQHVKGDIAVPNLPCDGPPPTAEPAGPSDDLPRWHEGMR